MLTGKDDLALIDRSRDDPSPLMELIMAWVYLALAGLFEIGWAVGLRATEGFSRPVPVALTLIAMVLSLGALGLALRTLPLGTAYAIWTGIGTVGTVIFGVIVAGESVSPIRLGAIALIVIGIAGLKLAGEH
ncbi:quaternary ammonium compound-resistance protein SugE [Kaistia dalseonensis]|uniref:Guanidinium exporter n=2 Tax=Kaistia dalseonensis TaxID=410840 RepID=A0ABU0HF92_9HYPH|nr:quaternary ammonium compound-resistance protein SugE [Kaistia dalseonensis]